MKRRDADVEKIGGGGGNRKGIDRMCKTLGETRSLTFVWNDSVRFVPPSPLSFRSVPLQSAGSWQPGGNTRRPRGVIAHPCTSKSGDPRASSSAPTTHARLLLGLAFEDFLSSVATIIDVREKFHVVLRAQPYELGSAGFTP